MPRNIRWNESVKENALNLVEALLDQADGEFDDLELQAAVQVEWVTENKLRVTGQEKRKRGKRERIVEVGTRKEYLVKLVQKAGKGLKLPKQQEASGSSLRERELEEVQTVLDCLKVLGVREDERSAKNQGYWKFTLTLQHQTATREENLQVVQQKWQEYPRTSSLTTSSTAAIQISDHSIDWQNVCRTMLERHKRLTTNQLMSADEEMKFELDEIHVPLALVQRTKPDKRSGDVSPEQGSRLYEPTYEEKQRFKHEEFLTQVLQQGKGQSQGRRIALIGEPGAGKTTLLQSIAFWILNNNLGVPIWISLADLQGRTIEEYLLQRWLKNALAVVRVNSEQENSLAELFKKERVWLLLDGVDEMAGDSVGARHVVPLQMIASQLEGWIGQARVVLSCRLNVWEANLNALGDDFETYRLLDFDYPLQVKEFICCWFRKSDADKGERLWTELDKSERQRLQDLVKNPLRLALLCSTWQSSNKGLPSTKAGLYQQFLTEFYKWKENRFPITEDQQEELNAALGRLAKRAIDQEVSRFRLQHKLVREELGDPKQQGSLFCLALQLGWLNQVGLAAESETQERVYAFFHPTFQEYFAALVIADWDFFLPHAHDNHNPKLVSDRYRIFEPQWKEVILLWLGREDVAKERKEEFIKALVEFEDGCKQWFFGYKGFYEYRAYFLAAAGIAEFEESSWADEIVTQIMKWGFGEFNVEFLGRRMYVPRQIAEQAKTILSETHRPLATATLINLIHTSPDEYICIEAAEILGKIEPGHPEAISTLLEIVQNNREWSVQAVESLGKIGKGNRKASAALVDLIHRNFDELAIRIEAASSLSQIDPGHPEAIPVIKDSDLYSSIFQDAVRLGYINPNQPEWIASLVDEVRSNPRDSQLNNVPIIFLLLREFHCLAGILFLRESPRNEREKFNRRWAVQHLKASDTSDPEAIKALIDLIHSNPDEDTLREAVRSLGQIGNSDPEAIALLIDLIGNSKNESIRRQAVIGLHRTDTSHEAAIWVLIDVIRTIPPDSNRSIAVQSLGQILQRYPFTLAVSTFKDCLPTQLEDSNDLNLHLQYWQLLWHCAQNMTYPAFYQAWHPQEEVGKTTTSYSQSLNQADLPQSLQSAIANDP